MKGDKCYGQYGFVGIAKYGEVDHRTKSNLSPDIRSEKIEYQEKKVMGIRPDKKNDQSHYFSNSVPSTLSCQKDQKIYLISYFILITKSNSQFRRLKPQGTRHEKMKVKAQNSSK